MSDDIKKTDAGIEEKPEAVKKTAVSKKKVKTESADDSANDTNKKNIIEKLRAMGVMSGKKTDATENDNSESGGFIKVTIAVVLAIGVVGSFVWALNKEAAKDGLTLNTYDHTVPSAYPNSHNPASNNPYNNRGYNTNNYNGEQQQRVQRKREQQKKWMQQQQQAQEQQRVQQQKWAQQWQQAQEQQRAQQQKWAQQPPTQGQYRSQQEKWAQQQRQAQEQQRMQQQKWAEQWRLAQEQQRTQQQQQNPYYNSSPQAGYQRQPYYNVPRYQQPGPSYGPQY